MSANRRCASLRPSFIPVHSLRYRAISICDWRRRANATARFGALPIILGGAVIMLSALLIALSSRKIHTM